MKKRINITIDSRILKAVDGHVNKSFEFESRSAYLQSLVLRDLQNKKLQIGPAMKIVRTWHDEFDMPLNPKYVEVK